MKLHYWKLGNPIWEWYTDDSNDYLKFIFRNGWARMHFWIPGKLCPNCKDWRLCGEFPFSCPPELKNYPGIGKGPISLKKHQELIAYVEEVFEKYDIRFSEELMDRELWMAPGTEFMDVSFLIPCHPAFSFFWPMPGSYPIVDKEVKDAFEENEITGATFHQVTMEHVGKAKFDEWEPNTVIPGSYDDEEFFVDPPRVIPPEEDPESFGPLYYMRVSHWGPDWTDPKEPKRYCKLCGRQFKRRKPKNLVFTEKHILTGYDVFRSMISNSIVLSEKVYQLFQDKKFTNAPLSELKVER